MHNSLTIALDAMGGDLGPTAAVAGSLLALQALPDLRLTLVGDVGQLEVALADVESEYRGRFDLVHATDVVPMEQSPREVLRSKSASSMRVALELVKKGRAQACLSSGNTGALVALSMSVLGSVPGIKRPAILSPIPSANGVTLMLDLGANAVCTPAMLFQFAIMGNVVARDDYGVAQPRVGLLNIGTEPGKGTQLLQEADTMLRASALNYVGFIEGNHIFTDAVDVVVSDGFTGNVALKAMEGFAQYCVIQLSKAAALDTTPKGESDLLKLLDTRTHNGAILVGLDGIVVKSHGAADETAFYHAIQMASTEIHSQIPQKIGQDAVNFACVAGELGV